MKKATAEKKDLAGEMRALAQAARDAARALSSAGSARKDQALRAAAAALRARVKPILAANARDLKAARRLAAQGVATALLSGRRPRALHALLAGEKVGTVFARGAERLQARKGWLAAAARGKGVILVDAGARRALVEAGKSLLPSGVRTVNGSFKVGDPVDIAVDPARPFARGLAGYGADEIRRIAGLKTSEIERALGYKYLDEVVHRDDLVVLEQGRE